MNGLILLAHGSRDPGWVAPFEMIRAKVDKLAPESNVALAYMEHSAPDFATSVEAMVQRGVTHVDVVPLFLGSGGHVRSDVPALVARASAKHANVKFRVHPFAGDADPILEAIAEYAAAVIGNRDWPPAPK